MRYKEECNDISELVGSPKIDQQKVEALKGILKLVLVAQKLLLELMEELAEITTELYRARHLFFGVSSIHYL